MDPATPYIITPVGQLVADVSGTFQPFPDFTIEPGETVGPIIFVGDNLDLPTTKKILNNIDSLIVTPVVVELVDAEDVPLKFNMTEVGN